MTRMAIAPPNQIAVAIAPEVEQLTIFQRSRHWLMNNPEVNQPVSEGVKWALRHIPKYEEWFRFRVYWFAADGLFANVVRDPTWPHPERSVSAHNEAILQYTLAYYREKLADRPDLMQKLLPEATVFDTGTNEWKQHAHWPPRAPWAGRKRLAPSCCSITATTAHPAARWTP